MPTPAEFRAQVNSFARFDKIGEWSLEGQEPIGSRAHNALD
jgi:hypothetical protein